MKTHRLSQFVGISVLSLSVGVLPLMLLASAQTNIDPATSINSGDRDFDWGWLGLLGLIGLTGLKGGKKQETTTQYRNPNTVGSRSGSRY